VEEARGDGHLPAGLQFSMPMVRADAPYQRGANSGL